MNFSTKKRPRKEGQAWRELQRELDERERLEEENAEKFARLDQLRARTAQEEEIDETKTHACVDVLIGREMGKDPKLTRGRLIFELFDDIMPRTVEQFIRMLEARTEPTYVGSSISKILPGYKCEAGDRSSRVEGASTSGKELVFTRVEHEANWQVPHLNPACSHFATSSQVSSTSPSVRRRSSTDGTPCLARSSTASTSSRPSPSRAMRTASPSNPSSSPAADGAARDTHPREFLKAMEMPKEEDSDSIRKAMRYSSTYRHTGLIGH